MAGKCLHTVSRQREADYAVGEVLSRCSPDAPAKVVHVDRASSRRPDESLHSPHAAFAKTSCSLPIEDQHDVGRPLR